MSPQRLRLPTDVGDPAASASLRYLQDNASPRVHEVEVGEPKVSELEDHVPTWREVGGVLRLYVRHKGVRWFIAATKG